MRSRTALRASWTAGAVVLVGAALATWPTPAAAQEGGAAEQLLRQVVPGLLGGGDPAQAAADAERACERYAEDEERLDVRDVLGTRAGRSEGEVEVTMRVEDRGESYDARCTYDVRDRRVAEIEPLDDGRRGDRDEIDERLAREARDACQEAAERRDLDDIEIGDVRERDRGTVEVSIEARDRGDRLDVTCLYDESNEQAFLSDAR